MGPSRTNVERTLVALQAVALCCLVMAAALSAWSGTGITIAIVWFILTPVMGALWTVRPRVVRSGHGIVLTTASVVLVTPVALLGRLNFTIPVLLLVVAFAVLDVSTRAGIYASIWIAAAGFALLSSSGLGSWQSFAAASLQGVINMIPLGVLLGFGVVLGVSLRSFEQRREADQKTIARLRHAAEVEKELLLSDERARSARELHDGLGHRLTLVSMSLELAERMREHDADQAWAEIGTAKETSTEALAEMRTWVRALSPVRDAGARGLAALESIAESFRGTGLTVRVTGDEASDDKLAHDDAIALLMYRAVQEGLTNALRHSRARNVHIDLHVGDADLQLVITNDFGRAAMPDVNQGAPALGFGLSGLARRAADRGGSMHARRIDDRFRLDLCVPINSPVSENRETST